jgi:hypothetical protein
LIDHDSRIERMTARDHSFTIPDRPRRSYPQSGGVEYEGETVFELEPASDPSDDELDRLVATVLSAASYRFGDFMELPMTLYLVRDEQTTDVFRVAVRDGSVRLYVLPETESAGLRRFYERLVAHSACEWRVECRTDSQ